jgi:hypothetical protein
MTAVGEYICDNCHEPFIKGWSDAEAMAEYDRTAFAPYYRESDPRKLATVCDDCYKTIMGRATEAGAAVHFMHLTGHPCALCPPVNVVPRRKAP